MNPTANIRNTLAIFIVIVVMLSYGCGGGSGGSSTSDIDNSPIPTVSVYSASANEGDSGTVYLTFNVTLSAPVSNTVTVSYITADVSATSGVDYVATSGTLTFVPSESTSQIITVSINGDINAEQDETLSLTLSNPTGGIELGIATATGTIVNDDSPVVKVSRSGVFEGDSGSTDLIFHVNLSTNTIRDVMVNYATSDGTAVAGSDYTSNTGILTIPAGNISGTVTVSVSADSDVEPDETLVLSLSNPINAALLEDTDSAIGTITNDDGPFGLDIRPINTTCIAGDRPGASSANITLERTFPNLAFSAPLTMKQAPNDDSRWHIAERDGRIRIFQNSDTSTTSDLFVDISGRVDNTGEGGLLGMAFHPNYSANGYVYLSYTTSDNGSNFRSVISRFTSDGSMLDPASELVMITVPQPWSTHNGGNIGFGQDGYLYIGFGDGGGAVRPENSQDNRTLLGAILRIDVNSTPYTIPPDNPFATNPICSNGSGPDNCPEIYAWGFRNPWRWSIDRQSGELWVGDVGENNWEEVDLVEVGGNYGWPCYEGNHEFQISGCLTPSSYTFPVAEYDHAEGNSITGGYIYRGANMPALVGSYIFGDFGSGKIWNLLNPYNNSPTSQELTSTSGLVSFAEDNTGELYVLNLYNGGIYRFVASNPNGTTMDTLLSQTGCADQSDPKLAPSGLIPYEINSPLWSDYAAKKRWFALPEGAQINILPDGDWEFPIGSVLRKDFYLSNKIIETRVLMRHNDGGWQGYSYEWNDAETDATLLSYGKTKYITATNQYWSYPSPAQCLQCHTAAANFALGPETAQMNRDYVYPVGASNQVTTYAHIGMLSLPVFADKLADPYNSLSYPLDERARSYLHSNCSNCHRQLGTGRGPADLRYYLTFIDMNICDQVPVVSTLGITDARLLVPGSPSQSITSIRMHSLDSARMPPIGSSIVHSEGTQLIDNWITSITSCQ